MKKSLLRWTAILGTLCAVLFYSQVMLNKVPQGQSEQVEQRLLPDIGLTHFDGSEATLRPSNDSQILAVHLWATWCSSCLEELPVFAEIASRFAAKGLNTKILSVDDDLKDVLKFYRTNHVTISNIEHGLITSNELVKFSTTQVPETILYNSKGLEIKRFVGPQDWNDKKVISQLEKFLK